jgi:UDP-hydrolysing UDP-N-acetyl-D-glucosamine 2-epimerase
LHPLLRVVVVTGSRADYGLLKPLLQRIRASETLDLHVVVTGMHLSLEFGETWRAIEADGIPIARKVDMLVSGDGAVSVTKSIGLGVIGFADALEQLKPHIAVVLGDRFEILAAVQACLIARIPVAHIAGGDTTEGAFDESIRHAITKMAHIHFVTSRPARERVRQMGEDPANIHLVGSPGIDAALACALLDRDHLEEALGFRFLSRNLLITFHPATLDPSSQEHQMEEIFRALDRLGPDTGLLFTLPNADTGGRRLMALVRNFVTTRPNSRAFTSLGQQRYLSLMAQVDVVVGNSSSGLYEAPTFKIPTVNIGNRQKGRLRANSILDCPPEADAVFRAIHAAYELDTSSTVSPYGDGMAAERIAAVLESLKQPSALIQKRFHPIECR